MALAATARNNSELRCMATPKTKTPIDCFVLRVPLKSILADEPLRHHGDADHGDRSRG
jgi:hypothetical protein